MGKPGYFSDDVWAAVRTALDDAGIQSSEADYGNGTVFEVEASVIARAILAAEKRGEDRQRKHDEAICVVRSDRHKAAVANYPEDEPSRVACLEGAIEALDCAQSIRTGKA